MFMDASNFNQDISKWNVGNVTHLISMFNGALNFNKPIGNWDVSSVESMNFMFSDARLFNQDISKWNVKQVEFMTEMFFGAESFNKNISMWDIGKVKKMDRMFKNAKSFNQDLSGWSMEKFGDKANKKSKKPSGMFVNATSMNKTYFPFNLKITTGKETTENINTNKKYLNNVVSKLRESISEEDEYNEMLRAFNSPKSREEKEDIIDKMTVEQRKRLFSDLGLFDKL